MKLPPYLRGSNGNGSGNGSNGNGSGNKGPYVVNLKDPVYCSSKSCRCRIEDGDTVFKRGNEFYCGPDCMILIGYLLGRDVCGVVAKIHYGPTE